MLTITGCQTVQPKSKVELPPRPQRQHLAAPETVADYARAFVYYESLVEQWEAWADTVEEISR